MPWAGPRRDRARSRTPAPFDDADLGPDDTEADVVRRHADLDDETGEITPAAPPLTLPVVEALLDRRWPETKISPTLQRITALLDLLGQSAERAIR